ncbi:hypothetical protein [Pseudoalteromonas sp. BDTF-M6]|uniref:hypothetical protein n=1 Tax=Pseudoalteromonas sp. BDTF-M6 TaxID=2796132 RepID=UPI001BB01C9F|nr:hypothetical protein [Pseudoalteromonas sp. BDTF-M6]MBS3799091.1 hypothetical protein [Pseudoalteromonas sp. BDTF-M6]
MSYKSSLRTAEVGLIALAFGIVCFFMGGVLFMSDPTPLPSVIKRFLSRHQEFIETAELLVMITGNLIVILGAFLIDFGFKFLFSKKYKEAFVSVSGSGLSIPNFLTGEQVTIPSSAVIGIDEFNKNIHIRYWADKEECSIGFPLFLLKEPDGFIPASKELSLDQANADRKTESQNQDLYSVVFGKENAVKDRLASQLTLIAKLVKRPLNVIQQEYSDGSVVIRKSLSKEKSLKLKAGLKKYQIDASIVAEGRDSQEAEEPVVKPRLLTAPSFPVVVTLGIIPGGLVLWLLINRFLRSQHGRKAALQPTALLVAVVVEMLVYETVEGGTTDIVIGLIMLSSFIFISFSVKRTLESEFGRKLSTIKTILFSLIYVNYKTNQFIAEEQARS